MKVRMQQALLNVGYVVRLADLYNHCSCNSPIITPFPVNSFARFTLLPGEPSTRSTLGSLSPTLTNAGAEAWKRRLPATERVAGRQRAAENIVRLASVYRVCASNLVYGDGGGWQLSEVAQPGWFRRSAQLGRSRPIAPSQGRGWLPKLSGRGKGIPPRLPFPRPMCAIWVRAGARLAHGDAGNSSTGHVKRTPRAAAAYCGTMKAI